MDIRRIIEEGVRNAIKENLMNERIDRIVSETIKRTISEGSEGKRKSASTKERQDRKIYNDPMTNSAELARKSLPKNWKDSTKRSYLSKLFSSNNKNPRKPDTTVIDKVHNAAS